MPPDPRVEAMLAEINEAMAPKVAPPQAMSFLELLNAAPAGTLPNVLRKWIQAEMSAGRWMVARRGTKTVYWKAE